MKTNNFRKNVITTLLLTGIFLLLFSFSTYAQSSEVTLSGKVTEKGEKTPLDFVNISLYEENGEKFISGTITDEKGRFELEKTAPGKYRIEISFMGYESLNKEIFVGRQSEFLDLGNFELQESSESLEEVLITTKRDEVNHQMDKKTFSMDQQITQSGGSLLQSMRSLPGISVQDEKVRLRGSDQVIILIDGKQTAITGIGGQDGLESIPASNVEKIEIINNPSAKYESSGSAGIINIITKKEKNLGWNGKAGISFGLGALWERKANYPGVRSQYKMTPKTNPSFSLNYKSEKVNVFLQADDYYTQILSNNDFSERRYEDGKVIKQQMMRNKNTNYFNTKAGVDWYMDEQNTFTFIGAFTKKTKTNEGDQIFYNGDLTEHRRTWKMYEDDHKTLAMFTVNYEHKFDQPGHLLQADFDYSFVRRDKDYDFKNILPESSGTDAFDWVADEHIYDFSLDYEHPMKNGMLEAGAKFLYRDIPSDMKFIPGENSVIDEYAGGWANYKEYVPAVYTNYNFETEKWEAELGLRLEYVKIDYEVNPDHPTYESDGFNYIEPFLNTRLSYKLSNNHHISVFYNRRVDRPSEKNLRIFPKYDDAEIIKVGNPALRPQFTHSFELGYKTTWRKGYLYGALFHKIQNHTLTRISTSEPDSDLIYDVFQNAGKSYRSGVEIILSQEVSDWYDFNLNTTFYNHKINAFSVENKYPIPQTFSADKKTSFAGDVKLNNQFHLGNGIELQLSGLYISPDIVAQGKEGHRFSLDVGAKKSIQKGKGELFFNGTDILNTLVAKRSVDGDGFNFTTREYGETQVFRIGYSYSF